MSATSRSKASPSINGTTPANGWYSSRVAGAVNGRTFSLMLSFPIGHLFLPACRLTSAIAAFDRRVILVAESSTNSEIITQEQSRL
jgi:hypothetical protein